jgi:uncharacterized membrane protein YcaP (DUF421 family)
MDGVIVPVLRTAVSFLILVIVTYAFGKHINSHENHFNFALSITIGSFIANMGFATHLKFKDMLIAFATLIIMFYILLLLSSRSRKIRSVISGRPTVLIENGIIIEENMKKIKYSIDDLNQQLRESGIFNIEEVEYALLEVSGNLSVMKKSSFQNPTRNDLNLPLLNQSLPVELIMDGTVIEKNAKDPYNLNWIKGECRKRNLQIEDVYYAVINSSGKLFIDKYNDKLSSPIDLE